MAVLPWWDTTVHIFNYQHPEGHNGAHLQPPSPGRTQRCTNSSLTRTDTTVHIQLSLSPGRHNGAHYLSLSPRRTQRCTFLSSLTRTDTTVHILSYSLTQTDTTVHIPHPEDHEREAQRCTYPTLHPGYHGRCTPLYICLPGTPCRCIPPVPTMTCTGW